MKTLNAAPLVALLLVVATLFTNTAYHTVGIPLRIGKVVPCYQGVRRVVVIRVLADGSIKINADASDRNRLGLDLDNIFRTRAVRGAYVTAEPEVAFAQVANVLDIASQHLEHVALFPRSFAPDRSPHPGEIDLCVDMSFTASEANMSDRLLPVWR
jgi:biopolymer transport protein ExbD